MSVNATVNTPRTTKASLSQANTSQVVRVTVPGPKGDSGNFADTNLQQLANIDSSSLANGGVLQYNSTSGKWVAVNDISNIGEVTINGGNF